MSKLTITVFGTFQILVDGRVVTTFPTESTKALLAYLVMHPGVPQSRRKLAALLWPDSIESSGRQNVRVALYRLRQTLAAAEKENDDAFFLVDRQTITFNPAGDYTLDAARLDQIIKAVRALPVSDRLARPDIVETVRTAVDLYQGTFLANLTIFGTPFEDWLVEQREKFDRDTLWLLETATQQAAQRRDYVAMAKYAQRQIEIDPWQESSHQQLMQALMAQGQHAAAIAHYESYRDLLQNELQTVPSAVMSAYYEQLMMLGSSTQIRANPFRGLDAFTESDAASFGGRRDVISLLLSILDRNAVATLIGSSGSGKSSVVAAGIIPRLRRDGWRIIQLQPGSHPLQALAEAIYPENTAEFHKQLAEDLAENRRSLLEILTAEETESPGIFLAVDQFEELYTLCADNTYQTTFIEQLLALQGETAVRALIAIRADFAVRALDYRPFADLMQMAGVILGPMTRAEMRQAIIQPATIRGIVFQDGLISRILDDVADAPSQLPLLQFALTLLWENRQGNWLIHDAYEAIDRVSGALSNYANNFYHGLTEGEQEQVRHIFLRLVQSGQNAGDTSRPATRAELPEAAWPLVQRLADARLLVTGRSENGQETAAIAHEALISGWELLQQWLDEDRAFHNWRQRLDAAQAQWVQSGQDSGALLRGVLLAEAEGWLQERPYDLLPASSHFIQVSLSARDTRQKALELQRRQELVQAQAVAEAESQRAELAARARTRLRWLASVLALVLVVAAFVAADANKQRQQAQRSATVSQSLNLTTNAQLALSEGDTDLALMLALEANRLSEPPFQAQRILAEAAYAPGARRIFLGHDGPVEDVVTAPDNGTHALSASADGTLILWDLQTGAVVRRFSGHSDAVYGVAFLPQGNQAMSASADGSLILWDVNTGDIVRRLRGHESEVWDVAISPNCDLALSTCQAISGAENGDVILWDIATGDIIRRFSGHSGAVYTVAISPNGRTILSGSADGNLILWDMTTGDLIYQLHGQPTAESAAAENIEAPNTDGHRGPVRDIVFGQDGRTAYSVADDLRIIYWDLETGHPLRSDAFNVALYSVDISPDGRYILLGRTDSQMILWSPYYGQIVLELLGHTSRIQAVAFSPDGRQAISGSADGSVRLWDLRSGAETRSVIFDGSALDVTLSPNGDMILLAGATGDLHLLDSTSETEIRRLVGHTETPFAGVLFRPPADDDSPLMAISGGGDVFGVAEDNTLRLWNVETGAEIRRFEGHTDRLWDFDVSGDGRFAVSASHDGTVRIWDLDQGTGRILADVSPQVARSVAISPDGRTILLGLAKGTSSAPDFSLHLLNAQTGETVRKFSGHTEIVSDIIFSPDGTTALSGSHDKLLILWDIATGQVLKRFVGHTGAVNQLRFSPETATESGGRLALSAGLDNLIILWDVETGQALRVYRGHVGGVMSVAFAPDGNRIFSVALDDSLREWRFDRTRENLQVWIEANRYVQEPTCEQRENFNIQPLCAADTPEA